MKYYILIDERYPEYHLGSTNYGEGFTHLTEEEYADFKAACAHYEKWQKRLANEADFHREVYNELRHEED